MASIPGPPQASILGTAARELGRMFLQNPRFYSEARRRIATSSKDRTAALSRSAIRSVYWRLLLGCISPTSVSSWTSQVALARSRWREALRDAGGDKELLRKGKAAEQVRKDLNRLNSDSKFFADEAIKDQMLRILVVWDHLNPDPGYRQGMHELVAPLLYVISIDTNHSLADKPFPSPLAAPPPIPSNPALKGQGNPRTPLAAMGLAKCLLDAKETEADTFCMFCKLMDVLKPLYSLMGGARRESRTGRMVDVKTPMTEKAARIQNMLLKAKAPRLHSHLKMQMVEPQLYLIRWLRLLFAYEFHLHDLVEVWDHVLSSAVRMGSGTHADLPMIDYIALAMLLHKKQTLMGGGNSECLMILMKYKVKNDAHDILSKAITLFELDQRAQNAVNTSPAPENSSKNHFPDISENPSSKDKDKPRTSAIEFVGGVATAAMKGFGLFGATGCKGSGIGGGGAAAVQMGASELALRSENQMLKRIIRSINLQLSERIAHLEDHKRRSTGTSRTLSRIADKLDNALAQGGEDAWKSVQLAIGNLRLLVETLETTHSVDKAIPRLNMEKETQMKSSSEGIKEDCKLDQKPTRIKTKP